MQSLPRPPDQLLLRLLSCPLPLQAALEDQALLADGLAFYRCEADAAAANFEALPFPLSLRGCLWCFQRQAMLPLTSNAHVPTPLPLPLSPHCSLSAAYMLRLASPSAAAGGPPTLPLPEPPLSEMGMLPVRVAGCGGVRG